MDSYEIITYRDKIANSMLSSERLLDFCGVNVNKVEPMWNNFFPQHYLTDVITETGTYIFYDIEAEMFPQKRVRNTFREVTIYFWVVSWRDFDWIKYKPLNKQYKEYTNRLRNDLVCYELEKIFKDKDILGIGENRLYGNKLFNTSNNKLTGRLLTFKVNDWDRGSICNYG